VKMLVYWRTSPPQDPTPVTPAAAADGAVQAAAAGAAGPAGDMPDDILALLNGLNDPLPACTGIASEWISVAEAAARRAYVVGLDTARRLPHKAVFDCRWAAAAGGHGAGAAAGGDDSKDKKGKGAPAKGKGAATGSDDRPPQPALCADPGLPPPTLLAVDASAFFVSTSTAPAAAEGGAEGGGEAAAAVAAQADELRALQAGPADGAGAVRPLGPYLTLSVAITADVVLPATWYGCKACLCT